MDNAATDHERYKDNAARDHERYKDNATKEPEKYKDNAARDPCYNAASTLHAQTLVTTNS